MTPEALRRQTAAHEGGHAAALVIMGLPVERVEVAGLDVFDPADSRYRQGGVTSLPAVPDDPDDLRRLLVATLAPLIDESPGAPDWPIPAAPPAATSRTSGSSPRRSTSTPLATAAS